PEHSPVQAVRAGLRDDVKYTSSSTAEFHAKVARLYGNFFDGVSHIEGLRDTGEGDVVVLGAVEQIVVRAEALSVYRERRFRASSKQRSSCGIDSSWQRARQRNRIHSHQRESTHVIGYEIASALRRRLDQWRAGFHRNALGQ